MLRASLCPKFGPLRHGLPDWWRAGAGGPVSPLRAPGAPGPRPAGWPRPNPKTQALRSPTDKTDDWRYDWLSNGVICEFALDRVDLTFAWPSNIESRALPMMLSIWSP